MLPRIWNISHNGRFKYMSLSKQTLPEGLDIMRRSFFPDELISQICEVPSNPKAIEELIDLTRDSAKDGISTVAVDTLTNKLAGIHINKFLIKNEDSIFEKHIKICHEKQSKAYCQFMIEADSKFNCFEYFNADFGFGSLLICVAPQYRGMGISHKFIKTAVDVAKALSRGDSAKIPLDFEQLPLGPIPKFIYGLRTNSMAANSKDKLGFELLRAVRYNEHVINGQKFGQKMGDFTKIYAVEAIGL